MFILRHQGLQKHEIDWQNKTSHRHQSPLVIGYCVGAPWRTKLRQLITATLFYWQLLPDRQLIGTTLKSVRSLSHLSLWCRYFWCKLMLLGWWRCGECQKNSQCFVFFASLIATLLWCNQPAGLSIVTKKLIRIDCEVPFNLDNFMSSL